MTALDLYVQTGNDDATQAGTTVALGGATSSNDLDATDDWVGVRFGTSSPGGGFEGVAIPQGATIDAAYLTVQVTASTLDEPDVTIFCEAADNAAQFTSTASDISNRTRTSASVAWSNADLGSGTNQDFNTPSLVSIVQEVVNRAGWASGNAMVFIFQGSATATRDLRFLMFETAQAQAVRLHVEYSIPTGSTGLLLRGVG